MPQEEGIRWVEMEMMRKGKKRRSPSRKGQTGSESHTLCGGQDPSVHVLSVQHGQERILAVQYL
jgi:hypothetical protein